MFWLGIFGDLSLLGFYKYSAFLADNFKVLSGLSIPLPHLLIPLAISFFTFQQITYLRDCMKRQEREESFLDYALFASIFPSLIAGPVTKFRELYPQLRDSSRLALNRANLAHGLLLCLTGLVKKTVLADTLGIWASHGFDKIAQLSFLQAWTAATAYTLQIYYDFSGYSDMALGSALILNFKLPWNFNSPFKAAEFRDFWRRWHMSFSDWIREYLFEPLQMTFRRAGIWGTALSLMIAFTALGLWHGPTWGYVAFGALHGLYMAVSVLLQNPLKRFKKKIGKSGDFLPTWAHITATFLLTVISFVFFRAPGISVAFKTLRAMFGFNGQPSGWLAQLEALNNDSGMVRTAYLGAFFVGGLWLAFGAENSKESGRLFKRPVLAGLLMALMLLLSLAHMNKTTDFLYFNY